MLVNLPSQFENRKGMKIFTRNNRLLFILTVALAVLFIPFIAMNFSDEVNWTFLDFMVAGLLLVVTGFLFEFILRKVKKTTSRVIYGLVLFFALFLVWAELAVGIFGTPWAGS